MFRERFDLERMPSVNTHESSCGVMASVLDVPVKGSDRTIRVSSMGVLTEGDDARARLIHPVMSVDAGTLVRSRLNFGLVEAVGASEHASWVSGVLSSLGNNDAYNPTYWSLQQLIRCCDAPFDLVDKTLDHGIIDNAIMSGSIGDIDGLGRSLVGFDAAPGDYRNCSSLGLLSLNPDFDMVCNDDGSVGLIVLLSQFGDMNMLGSHTGRNAPIMHLGGSEAAEDERGNFSLAKYLGQDSLRHAALNSTGQSQDYGSRRIDLLGGHLHRADITIYPDQEHVFVIPMSTMVRESRFAAINRAQTAALISAGLGYNPRRIAELGSRGVQSGAMVVKLSVVN